MFLVRIIATALVLGCCLVTWGDEPKIIGDYRHLAKGRPVIGMTLPNEPLTERIVERWADKLNASDAQREFMLHQHRKHVTRHNDLLDREAPPHMERGMEVGRAWVEDGPNSPSLLEAIKAADRHNKRLRQQLIDLEHLYISELRPVLTAEQRDRLYLLELDATRRNCRTFRRPERWTSVELRDLWQSTASGLASPEEEIRVEVLLASYERRLTTLLCRHADRVLSLRHELAENRIRVDQGEITPEEGRVRYENMMQRNLDVVQRIRALTERTARDIALLLSESVAEMFVTSLRQHVYPELYPDRYALHAFFESLLDEDQLDGQMRQAAAALLAEYQLKYDRAREALEGTVNKWFDNNEAGVDGYQRQFLPEALQPLLDERTELSCRYFEQLHELVGPDVLARHAEAIPPALRSQVEDLRTD